MELRCDPVGSEAWAPWSVTMWVDTKTKAGLLLSSLASKVTRNQTLNQIDIRK